MLTLGISDATELRYVAAQLRKAAARDLTRELRKGQRDAYKPLQAEIKAEAVRLLPSGYGPLMSRAVRVSVTTSLGRNAVTARVYARGKQELRDVRSINNGILRHPVFGNRTRWAAQRVRRGFVDRPADRIADRVLKESADAVERVLTKIARS